ncbi:unnamed protein product [Rhizophagus irregularis]|nr:unnamed protein product [Rhizophagus irregularis]
MNFTEDYDSLITKLNQLNLQPNDSNREMKLACEYVENYVIEKFGPDQACQIIMLTDGRSPQKQESQSIQFHNPSWKLHIICLADTDSILSMMDIILEKYFLPCKGLLLCGQLRFPIKVYPVLPDVEYIHDIVRTLSIVAFKPREKLLGEPSIFRLWMFVDEEYDDQDKQVRNNYEYFSALWKCLRKENHVAIVWMKGDNYAAIEPPPSTDNQEDPKENDLFMYFTIYKSENGKNLLSEPSTSVTPPPPKSYVAGHNIDLPTPEHIESLLNKMSRYLTNLPNDAVKLKNVVEQMQKIIEIFSYKPLREHVVDKLHDVRIQSVEIENRQILAECLVTLGEETVIYSARPDQVTALSSRTFAIWTLLSAIIRIYAAYNITEVNIYQIAIWTYVIAWLHFISEFFIFRSAKISAGWLSPVIVSTFSLIWMLSQYDYYTQQNIRKY